MIICHCFKVTDKQIKDCINKNLDPIKETKAGTACRGCREAINNIIKESKELDMQDNYNYHDWSKFMVREPKDAPKGAHYGVVLLGIRNEYSPPYDKHDTGGSYSVPEVTYFAFILKEDLDNWVERAIKAEKKFFFFRVDKLGSAQVKVETNL